MALLPDDFSISSLDDMDTDLDEFNNALSEESNGLPVFSQDNDTVTNDLDNFHSDIIKENVFLSPKMKMPSFQFVQPQKNIIRQPLADVTSAGLNPVTPTKPNDADDPVTPTANLKMLMSAISPEIRIREQKKELFRLQNDNSSKSQRYVITDSGDGNDGTGRRKDKSLGLLCQKFLSRFPEYPDVCERIEIGLDFIAKDLAVERRRIYDIVNVLESIEIVSRMGKNSYSWHGKTLLPNTLSKLKALGLAEGYLGKIAKVKQYETYRDNNLKFTDVPFNNENSNSSTEENVSNITAAAKALLRKDKSLGIMSQKFLMLFLVAEPEDINLDLAAKILIGDVNVDKTETSKYKTKIRRLYDIANILTSLGLIEKCQVAQPQGRVKPAFRYIGPSLLAGGEARKQTFSWNKSVNVENESVSNKKQPFSRKSSFEQICQVVEQERDKLNQVPKSLPTKAATSKAVPTATNTKRVVVKKIPLTDLKLQPKSGSTCSTKKITTSQAPRQPSTNIVQQKKPQTTILQVSKEQLQALLLTIAAKNKKNLELFNASTQCSPPAARLEKDVSTQYSPVMVKQEDACTQYSPQSFSLVHNGIDACVGADSPMFWHQTSDVGINVNELSPTFQATKRPLDEVQFPPAKYSCVNMLDTEVAAINVPSLSRAQMVSTGRPSPLRALHLEPEFKVVGMSPGLEGPIIHGADTELASPLSNELEEIVNEGPDENPQFDPDVFIQHPNKVAKNNENLDTEIVQAQAYESIATPQLTPGYRQVVIPVLPITTVHNNQIIYPSPTVMNQFNTPTRSTQDPSSSLMKQYSFSSPENSVYHNTPGSMPYIQSASDWSNNNGGMTQVNLNSLPTARGFLPIVSRRLLPNDSV